MTGARFTGQDFDPNDPPTIDADDPVIVTGHGCYESLKVRDGILFFPELHVARLLESARILEIRHDLEAEILVRALRRLVAGAAGDGRGPGDGQAVNIRLMLLAERVAPSGRALPWELWALIIPAPEVPPRLYEEGCAVVTFEAERPWPQAKSLGTLAAALGAVQYRRSGAYETLLVDREGLVREGTRSNLAVFSGDALVTPPDDMVLSGVTLHTALQVAGRLGIGISYRAPSRSELLECAAAFVCSTSARLVPVASVDGVSVGSVAYRPLRDLMRAYDEFLADYGRVR